MLALYDQLPEPYYPDPYEEEAEEEEPRFQPWWEVAYSKEAVAYRNCEAEQP